MKKQIVTMVLVAMATMSMYAQTNKPTFHGNVFVGTNVRIVNFGTIKYNNGSSTKQPKLGSQIGASLDMCWKIEDVEMRVTPAIMYISESFTEKEVQQWNNIGVSHLDLYNKFSFSKLYASLCFGAHTPVGLMIYAGVYYGHYQSIKWGTVKKQYNYNGQLADEQELGPSDLVESGEVEPSDFGFTMGLRKEISKYHIYFDLGYNKTGGYDYHNLNNERSVTLSVGYHF